MSLSLITAPIIYCYYLTLSPSLSNLSIFFLFLSYVFFLITFSVFSNVSLDIVRAFLTPLPSLLSFSVLFFVSLIFYLNFFVVAHRQFICPVTPCLFTMTFALHFLSPLLTFFPTPLHYDIFFTFSFTSPHLLFPLLFFLLR